MFIYGCSRGLEGTGMLVDLNQLIHRNLDTWEVFEIYNILTFVGRVTHVRCPVCLSNLCTILNNATLGKCLETDRRELQDDWYFFGTFGIESLHFPNQNGISLLMFTIYPLCTKDALSCDVMEFPNASLSSYVMSLAENPLVWLQE